MRAALERHVEGGRWEKGNGGDWTLMLWRKRPGRDADQTGGKESAVQRLWSGVLAAVPSRKNLLWSAACSSLPFRLSGCSGPWAPEPVPEPDTLPLLLCHEVCHLCPLCELTPAHPVPGMQRQSLRGPGCGCRASEWFCLPLRYRNPLPWVPAATCSTRIEEVALGFIMPRNNFLH